MKAFQILLVVMTVFALVWFVVYERRRQSSIPSKPEKALAYGWLIFRRVACFSVAAFFGIAGIAVLVVPQGSSFFSSVGAFLLCAVITFIAAWVGMYGGGRRRAMWDDQAVHRERKKRYGWRW